MGAEPLQIRFEELYEHAGWVRALARSLVVDSGLADDLVQETWLAALRRPPSDRRNLRGWLGRVVTNAARQRHRREAPRSGIESGAGPEPEGETPEDLVAAVEGHRELAELVVALEEPYRSTVILRYWHGLDSAQIARRQGTPAGTVRWRLKEGLDRLRARLDERHGGDRRAWCLALLPLARQGAVPAGAAALPAVLQGVLGMHVALKLTLSAAALALVVLTLGYTGIVDLGLREPMRPVEVTQAAAPALEPDRREPEVGSATLDTVRRTAAPRETEPSVPSVPPSAPELAHVEARAVDLEGYPIDRATLRTGSSWGQPVEGAAAGGLVLEVDPHGDERGMDFIVRAPAHAATLVQGVVRRGETLHLGDIVLGPGGDVAGRVVDAHGGPIEGARVGHIDDRLPTGGLERARLEASSHGSFWTSVATDADGRFLLQGVPAERVRIQAEAEGRLAAISEPLDVPVGDRVEGVELTLEPLPRDDVIAGQVMGADGEPVSGATVRLEYESWFSSGSHSTTTDREGRFEVLCRTGHARKLQASDRKGRWSDVVIEEVRPGTVDLVVRLDEPIVLLVDVRGPDGARLEQVELDLWDPPRRDYFRAGAERTESGLWRLGAPGERFVIVASAPGHEERELGPFDPASLPEVVDCALASLPGVRGVVLAGGVPVAGARVEVVEEERDWAEKNGFPVRVGSGSAASATSDAEGGFDATLRRRGRFYVRVEAEGWAAREHGPVEIDPRSGLDLGRVELTPGGAIEGRVVVDPGTSPTGTVVSVSRGDGHARTQRVGPDGRFRFEHLIPGRWQVEVRDEELDPGATSWSSDSFRGRAPIPSNCTVVEGQTTFFDLSPAGEAACALVGTLVVDGAPSPGWTARLHDAESRLVSDDDPGEETDAEGRFRLARAQPGRYRLLLSAEDGLGLLAEVDLVEGSTSWSAELETATLDVEGLVPFDERIPAALYLWERDELLAAVQLFADDDGAARGLRIPAGAGRIVRIDPLLGLDDPRDLPTLAEVDAPAGETTLVRLP